MPTPPQVRTPRFVVAIMLASLFAVSLFAMRQYVALGDLHALTLGVAAGTLCLLTAAGLIYANYETYCHNSDSHA
ncbi:hypothetical protein ACERK3_09640 [Phycisphaerales bacterium AB-hyl4]|uniref:Uncharacterized protein n=1 Tax=Natronomicrosphaera hydrolytica TaxID=3242702 RepID=A0ABV4U6S8_9BACT